jgi:uncharacterized membrane protein YczE
MKLIGRIFEVVAAAYFTGLGVSLIVAANLGLDPLTILEQGLSRFFGINFALTVFLVSCILLSAAAAVNIHKTGVATVINPFLVSMTIFQFEGLIPVVTAVSSNLIVRMVIVLIGQCACSLAFGLLISCGLGPFSLDVVIMHITKRLKVSYPMIRYVFDISMCIVGWRLGGVIGIGTAITACTQGPLIATFQKFTAKFSVNQT